MPISMDNYVDISSSVGGNNTVPERKLTLRAFDDNALIPTGDFVTFTNAADVGTYFGTNSEEYARAVFYFGWVSKSGNIPPTLDFARWNAAATAPVIYGAKGPQSLASYTPISTGAFILTLGGITHTIGTLNFTSATSLANVASIIQTAVRAAAGTGMWTAATVTFDATNSRFVLTGGAAGVANILVAAGTGGNDIAGQLGWLSATAILSNGAAAEEPVDAFTASVTNDNNFGSFLFMGDITQNQIVANAEFNDTLNNQFMYSVACDADNASALFTVLGPISGVGLTLNLVDGEFAEMVPCMIEAATAYDQRNGVQSYDYQPNFDLTPSVSNNEDLATYEALNVNFYGVTQTAGVLRAFYQPGFLMGAGNDATDMNVYANEQWFKDAAQASLLTLLLSLNQIPANLVGKAQMLGILQGVIQDALFNGTIEPTKTLTTAQKATITQLTGDPLAWQQVFNQGYWVDITITPTTVNDKTVYVANYLLIYSKDDTIRKINGRDILI